MPAPLMQVEKAPQTNFLNIFLKHVAASAAKYCKKGAVNLSAASAASPDYVKFQAMIKSVVSAASRKTKIQGRLAVPRGPQSAVCGRTWVLVFLEAALAAGMVTAWHFVQLGGLC